MSYKNFISKLFSDELTTLKESDRTKARLEPIAWPSECSADLGPYTVGECQRNLFYRIIGATPTENMSLRVSHICNAGLMYEKYHIDRFKARGLYKDEQIKVRFVTDTKNKVAVSGKMDLLIEFNGKKRGIEIKSVSAFKAAEVFGQGKKKPLPAVNNLMQAMLYKDWTRKEGKKHEIEEIYLMYINRSDNATCYFKVDLDEQGYAIVTAIDTLGEELYKINMQQQKSYSELLAMPGTATTEQARLAELRVSTKDIYDKFDKVYDYVYAKSLPPTNYSKAYSEEEINQALKCGKLTKRKVTMTKKKGDQIVDFKCAYCPYVTKCLSDSGVNVITF